MRQVSRNVVGLVFGILVAAETTACGQTGSSEMAADPVEDGGGDAGAQRVMDLVSVDGWRSLDEAEDPFAERLLPGAICDLTAFAIEGQGPYSYFEIQTEICSYATIAQPAKVAVEAGDRLVVVAWHNTLATSESAEAFVAVHLGDEPIWELTVPIPSDAESYQAEWTAPRDFDAGTRVTFHVDNHGTNAWRLSAIRVTR